MTDSYQLLLLVATGRDGAQQIQTLGDTILHAGFTKLGIMAPLVKFLVAVGIFLEPVFDLPRIVN